MADTATSQSTGIVRLNVNLNAETAAALKSIAEERDISVTEAVRRAIAVFDFLEHERGAGRKLQTVDADNRTTREVVLL